MCNRCWSVLTKVAPASAERAHQPRKTVSYAHLCADDAINIALPGLTPAEIGHLGGTKRLAFVNCIQWSKQALEAVLRQQNAVPDAAHFFKWLTAKVDFLSEDGSPFRRERLQIAVSKAYYSAHTPADEVPGAVAVPHAEAKKRIPEVAMAVATAYVEAHHGDLSKKARGKLTTQVKRGLRTFISEYIQ